MFDKIAMHVQFKEFNDVSFICHATFVLALYDNNRYNY